MFSILVECDFPEVVCNLPKYKLAGNKCVELVVATTPAAKDDPRVIIVDHTPWFIAVLVVLAVLAVAGFVGYHRTRERARVAQSDEPIALQVIRNSATHVNKYIVATE